MTRFVDEKVLCSWRENFESICRTTNLEVNDSDSSADGGTAVR